MARPLVRKYGYFHRSPISVDRISRWVTGVGATQISKGNTVNDPESAAEESWAGIASGGGFSFIFEPPKYQKEALARYFEVSNNASDLPFFTDGKYKGNDGVYNRNGRGVPDIAASRSSPSPEITFCR
jgi:tripeptidyl-peptidase-1